MIKRIIVRIGREFVLIEKPTGKNKNEIVKLFAHENINVVKQYQRVKYA